MKKHNRLRIYKVIALAVALVLIYSLSAFSLSTSIDERAVVTMMGIDYKDDEVCVTAHLLVSVLGGENAFVQDTAEGRGATLFEALNRFSVLHGRKAEFSHCGLVVVGESMLERGIRNEMQALLSAGTLSPGTLLIASKGESAQEFVVAANDLGLEANEDIARFINRFERSLSMPHMTLVDFLRNEMGESGASFLPAVKLEYRDEALIPQGQMGPPMPGEGEDEEIPVPVADIASIDTAIVTKGGVKTGELNKDETMGLNFTKPQSNKGIVTIDGFTHNEKEYGAVFAQVKRKRVRVSSSFKDGKPHILYDIVMYVDVSTKHEFLHLTDFGQGEKSAIYRTIENAFSEKAVLQVTAAAKAAKDLETDFMGWQYRFARRNSRKKAIYTAEEENVFLNDIVIETRVRVRAR